jgi:type III secretion system FlhB-like substrate exporter
LEGEGGSRGQEGEMAPTMYAYMNKWIKKKIISRKKKNSIYLTQHTLIIHFL